MMQIIPMTVEEALKAADTYSSPLNGTMVDVLASEVRRLQRHIWRSGAGESYNRIAELEALISKDPITGFICRHCKMLNEFTFTAEREVSK